MSLLLFLFFLWRFVSALKIDDWLSSVLRTHSIGDVYHLALFSNLFSSLSLCNLTVRLDSTCLERVARQSEI